MRVRFGCLSTVASVVLFSLPALASEVYTYTGNPMNVTYVSGGGYTTTDALSGSFTTATPLAANLAFSEIAVTSYSFTDGVQTLTDANSNGLYGANNSFMFSTDASGNILYWNFGLESNAVGADEIYSANDPFDPIDFGTQDNGQVGVGSALTGTVAGAVGNVSNAGTWKATSSVTATPEPSSLILLGTGLLGAVGITRRRLGV